MRAPLPFAVPPEVLDEFEVLFDEWERAAEVESFEWSREEARGFYRNRVAAILADLARESPEDFKVLEERWPPL